jgi:hypothetical protein
LLLAARSNTLFHLNTKTRALVFEHNGDGVDYSDVLVRLAVQNNFVLHLSALADIKVMLSRKAVLPPAVPGREHVSILLPCVGELGAGQSLHVDKPVGVSVGTEIDLSMRICPSDRESGCCQ